MADLKTINDFVENTPKILDGVIAICVVEIESGKVMGTYSNGQLNPEVASSHNLEVVKSKLKAIEALQLNETIEDILITLETQYHIINVTKDGRFMIYLAVDQGKSTLTMARFNAKKGAEEIEAAVMV